MMKAKIISLASEEAVISLDGGQKITVPVSHIEGSVKEGSEVAVIVAALGSEDAGRQRLAQDLLNGLLKA